MCTQLDCVRRNGLQYAVRMPWRILSVVRLTPIECQIRLSMTNGIRPPQTRDGAVGERVTVELVNTASMASRND